MNTRAVASALAGLAVLGTMSSPVAAQAAERPYSFSFKVLESREGSDGNVLRSKIKCPSGSSIELDAAVLLDPSDPGYDPTALVATGATLEDKFPEGFQLVLECTGKPQTHHLDLFPNLVGYDLPDEGPCIGSCHYHISPPLEAGQKVTITYSALTSAGNTVSGTSQSRVRK